MRVPAPPDGWQRAALVRLVDPTGEAMAWVSAGTGACVAFHCRGNDGMWRLADPGPEGSALPGTWRLVSRDPTSCVLGEESRQVQITVEGQRVRRVALMDRVP